LSRHTPNLLRPSSFTAAALGLALLGALVLSGCPKPKPPPAETDDRTSETPPVVGIRSVLPGETTAGSPVTVKVKGHGFLDGSEVYLGSRRARGVDVYDEGELTFRATEDLPEGEYDVRVVTPKGDQAVSVDAFRVKPRRSEAGDCVLRTVYFEFNESSLTSDTRQALADNARCVEAGGLSKVRLEGHADERGSTEYNLSLGQRRAESVKDYLVNLGASGDAFRTVSYGEERPVDRSYGDSAWAKNRRVEFVVP